MCLLHENNRKQQVIVDYNRFLLQNNLPLFQYNKFQ